MSTQRSRKTPATVTPLATRIAGLVRDSGIKHEALAARIGIGRVALGDRLRGRTRWNADELPALALALGVTFTELLGTPPGDAEKRTRIRTTVGRPGR